MTTPILEKLQNSRNVLGLIFMLPATVLLLLFLTYPLGLGVWLGFTDAKVGRPGEWIGLENYIFLASDSVTQLALFNTLFYTTIASVVKFFLGLWLALLLNKNIRFKSFFRAVILLPYIVPTALSAIAFWWIFDSQFSIISWVLIKLGWLDTYIDFLGEPWNARWSVLAANVWRGVPFVAITLLAGLQTISPSLYEAAAIDGATAWQRFRRITLPLLTPMSAIAGRLAPQMGAWALQMVNEPVGGSGVLLGGDARWREQRNAVMQESCRVFALVHAATNAAQRESAARRLRAYARDLQELAAQR